LENKRRGSKDTRIGSKVTGMPPGITRKEVHMAVLELEFPGGVRTEPKFMPEDITKGSGPEAEDLVIFDAFVRIVGRMEVVARKAFRANGGFTKSEVAELETQFRLFDEDDSGDISNKELILVIENLFPQMANDLGMRPKLVELLKEVDQDGDGALDFSDFLRLMRQFRDLEDRERAAKEWTAVEETGFMPAEVAEFRELFLLSNGTLENQLTLDEVKTMIAQICPLGDQNNKDLTNMFHLITRKHHMKNAQAETKDTADFPEFLYLMQRLLDSNFAFIRERTQVVVSSLEM